MEESSYDTGQFIACLDVDYRPEEAVAAGLWFKGWNAPRAEHVLIKTIRGIQRYEPGAFYRRELPCLLEVLLEGPRSHTFVVDGYVWLGHRGPGLGAHLHRAVGGVVVGVAKTRFPGAQAIELYRGKSRRPLYISAEGVDVQTAAGWIASMHGPYRMPTLLRQVDAISRAACLEHHY